MKDTKKVYLSDIKSIRDSVENECSGIEETLNHPLRADFYLTLYNIKKLGLKNFSPSYEFFFRNHLFYKALGNYQFSNFDDAFLILDDLADFNQQRIYTSGQFGSFKAISTFLVARKVKLCAILADVAITAGKKQYHSIYNRYFSGADVSFRYETIDATDPGLFFKLKRFKREGYSFLIYFDGDAGTRSGENLKNLSNVEFLKRDFYVRKGLAYISFILNIPIQPLYCVFGENFLSRMCFGELLAPDSKTYREDYAKKVINSLWNEYEYYVLNFPEQWIGLSMANQFYKTRLKSKKPFSINDSSAYTINKDRYKIIENDHSFLLDMENGIKFQISNNMLHVLKSIYKNRIILNSNDFREIFKSVELQQQFIENEIFTCTS